MGGVRTVRIFDGKVYRDMTAEEITAMEQGSAKAEAMERNRPMTEQEVTRLLITQRINDLQVDDGTALRMKEYYPRWAPGVVYSTGFKIGHGGKLWRVRQDHTAQTGWEPENAPSLWEQINEAHDGTLSDPIPYEGSMALEQGKHYYQNNAIYLCIRDTGNPVYHPLVQMLGLYVEEV